MLIVFQIPLLDVHAHMRSRAHPEIARVKRPTAQKRPGPVTWSAGTVGKRL